MKTNPDTFLKAMAPYREGIVVAVACLCTWYWLADVCADEGMPCVLGHALSMQALQGGKAKNDTIDSQKIASLLRGGRLPQASVSPAKRRATRDLLRRRRPLAHTRAELLAPVQHTTRQSKLPAIGKKIASQANRDGVAERGAEPAVHNSLEGDLALIPYDDALLRDFQLPIVKTAKYHDANTLYRLHPVPGLGTILSLVLLDDIPEMHRFPGVQDFVSSCRLGTWAKESAGNRDGTAGTQIGHAPRTWAFAEAAVLFLRDHPAARKSLARLENNHDTGKACTILAQKLARAVSYMLKRKVAFDRETFFPR